MRCVLVGIDDAAHLVEAADPRRGIAAGTDGHRPRPLFGGQGVQRGQVFLVGVGEHSQPRKVGDLEQVGRGVDQFAEGHVALDDGAIQRGQYFELRPLRDHLLAIGRLLVGKPLGLGPHLVDLLLGYAPALQRSHRPRYGNAVGLNFPPRVLQDAIGNGTLGRGLGDPREAVFIHAKLRQGVDQVALLLAQVMAPNHRQQLSLADELPEGDRPRPVGRLAQLDDLAGEPGVDVR